MGRQRHLLGDAKGRFVLRLPAPAGVRGLTLVEMLIALAIFGILVGLAVPGFNTSLAGLKVRTAAEKLLGAVQVARAEAVKRNAQVDFSLDSLQGAGWTVQLADGTVLQSYSGQEGSPNIVVAAAPLLAGNLISFNGLGQRIAPAAAAGAVTLSFSYPNVGACQPAGPIRCVNVTVSIGGAARMCDPLLTVTDPANPAAC